jgi:hypothetical protein
VDKTEGNKMIEKMTLVKLRISPNFPGSGIKSRTYTLVKEPNKYSAQATIQELSGASKSWRVDIPDDAFNQQWSKIKKAKLPAFPVSPHVLDGRYIELTIYGEHASLNMSWWTEAPKGAKALEDFSGWLEHVSEESNKHSQGNT